MTILYAGVNLAKNVFALHRVKVRGAVVLRQPKSLAPSCTSLVAALPRCTIVSEALLG